MNFNQITLAGNVSSDPELRFTPSGVAVASFSMAINEGTKDKQTTMFVRVTCWEKLGETVMQWLTKGQGVLISGKMQPARGYVRKDGDVAASNEVTAFTVQFGAKPKGWEGNTDGPPAPVAKATQAPQRAPVDDDLNIPF
jgi:single-strand DNA-binding protein